MATRILIADDHEMMRTVLRNMINSHTGWQVCAEAKNGSEAVAQAKELRPDLIVLDLAMPVMDGMRAAREITKSAPGTQMIMFTLHASPEVEEQAKRVGVSRVVSKAKNGGRLVSAIEQMLGESQETNFADDTATADLEESAADSREIRVHQARATADNLAAESPTETHPVKSSANKNSPDETGGSGEPPTEPPTKAR
jgi:DNA-binding NarL/FixJ family response regulator